MVSSGELTELMDEPRNGTSNWHKFSRGDPVAFSDGVVEVLNATLCGWLVILVGVDFVPALRNALPLGQGYAKLKVLCVQTSAGGRAATVTLNLFGEEAALVTKEVSNAEDFPVGEWHFILLGEHLQTDDREVFMMLPREY
ncbi:MAG: hypothetical protein IH627_10740 [Rubrivivax sp.]|nr:hypothetical protein [Rubrivivax sp.]